METQPSLIHNPSYMGALMSGTTIGNVVYHVAAYDDLQRGLAVTGVAACFWLLIQISASLFHFYYGKNPDPTAMLVTSGSALLAFFIGYGVL